ncbi:4044_t:CDS:2, partial [Acaulospora colombiana]
MALKYELEQWGAAVASYDENDYEAALDSFGEINKGVSHFLLEDFGKALANFNDALLYLRGNLLIDYEQLGLKFRLYSCEVLFNRGLCYLYLGQTEQGMNDFSLALKEKQTEDHDVIDEAIAIQGQGFTVFSIPVGIIYRPPEGKLKNVKSKDYLGKAKLVAAVDPDDAFTGFSAQMNTTTPISKARTDGTVDSIPRPDSPTDNIPRPRSLSTNPRSAPFPLRTIRNSGALKSRPADLDEDRPSFTKLQDGPLRNRTPIPIANEVFSEQGDNNTKPITLSRNGSARRPPPNQLRLQNLSRSNTMDSGRPSTKLSNAPLRVNSVRDQNRSAPTRSDSLRSRSNSPRGSPQLRGRGGRPMPQRQNTSARAQFLQKQMQNMSLSDEESYTEYFQNSDQSNPINNNGDYNQMYDFNSGNNKYYSEDSDYLRPNQNDLYGNNNNNDGNSDYNNSNRNPIDQRVTSPPAISPSSRGRSADTNFRPFPAQSVSTPNYANIVFSEDGYGEDDDTQFEMLPPPQKTSPTSPESLKEITKVKIKVYGKNDTRVVMVPVDIVFSELMKRIQEKFASDQPLKLKYKDDDDTYISMTDQEDWEIAIAMLPKSSNGIGRFE